MTRLTFPLLALLAFAGTAQAQNLLIRHATVHTAGARGTLKDADVLVQGGVIRAVGPGLLAPPGVSVIDAAGKRLTPGLFGGLGDIGLEEVSAEESTVDGALTLAGEGQPQMRPEFDVTLAYNPNSILIPVARLDGLTFTAIAANSGGSLIAGQGGIVRLDGDSLPLPGRRLLFTSIGSRADSLSGKSRAAQYMILDQAIREARGLTPYGSPNALLTPAGREALAKYLVGGRTVITVDRASDIRQVLAFSRRQGLRPVIVGGAESWQATRELKAANATVFIDALENLPASFDQLGARLDTAALLEKAGVKVAFYRNDDASPNARKIRQAAGNAVANGLSWEAGLAGLTRVPAEALGVGDQVGRIDVGLVGDLVLWDGDPLEVTSLPLQVWMAGKAMPMTSRQTELRDRYLPAPGALPRAYSR
ncbi:amidohydrolase family protein [Arenimonas oryziterrae]|uniref:Amidohydrolase-related domain-containing protein n=1 Tax=Arenimonas oryziterrae DSM 21050 = YC6267 TaxID=1121015 RepID=A0A091BCY3_9GAMM|nr:amidohydrolase family protein [Arenimonas oryziterrae]KFN42270.1 hypothetical protein N789_14395 [Arenimonas oryziterrae DSM 21050 = YC6267]